MNKVRKNYLYNLVYQVITLFLPLITIPYVSRVLGADGIGIYSYTKSIVTYFITFANFGISLYGQREIAYYQHSEELQVKTFLELISIRVITTGASLILYLVFLLHNTEYRVIYYIQIPSIIAALFDIAWYYQGLENYKFTVIRNIYVKVAGLLCIFIFVKTKDDLGIYIFCLSIITLLANISLWSQIIRKIKKYKRVKLEIRKHRKAILALYIPQVIIQLYTVCDKTMLGMLGQSSAESGYYEQAEKIARLAASVVSTLSAVMMPRISSLYSLGKMEQAYKEIKHSFQFVWLMGVPIMFGLIGIRKEFIDIFLGSGYEKVTEVLSVFSVIVLMVGLNNVTGLQYFIPMGKQKKFTISVCIGALVDIVMNLILIPRFQAVGAAISIVLAEMMITVVQFYYINQSIKVKKVLYCSWKYMMSGIIMLVIVEKIQVPQYVMTRFVIKVATGIFVYFFILFLLKEEIIYKEGKKLFFCKNRER
ncbi:MAG: flippase [Lachnospiraceae bacterium]|nr:flippase [Lachnospiraceae bacterium]